MAHALVRAAGTQSRLDGVSPTLFRTVEEMMRSERQLPAYFNLMTVTLLCKAKSCAEKSTTLLMVPRKRLIILNNALAKAPARLTKVVAVEEQMGLLPGRPRNDNVYKVDTVIASSACTCVCASGAVRSNFKNAFPATAWVWILTVLAKVGVRSPSLRLIPPFHDDCRRLSRCASEASNVRFGSGSVNAALVGAIARRPCDRRHMCRRQRLSREYGGRLTGRPP